MSEPHTRTKYYYAEDFLGSSRAMVQAGATSPCFDADFLPFGREKDAVASCIQNNYKFEGKERDTETGNDDFGARYYSSNLGRWLSPDWSAIPASVPYANLANPQTLNLYAMAQDDPETFADLDGHDPPKCDPDRINCEAYNAAKNACNPALGCNLNNPLTWPWDPSIKRADVLAFLYKVQLEDELHKFDLNYQLEILAAKHPQARDDIATGLGIGIQVGALLLPGSDVAEGAELTADLTEEVGTALARRLGQEGEAAVGDIGPKIQIKIPGSGRIRIPDGLTDNTLSEVKNVRSLSYTQQLRDFTTYSQATGRNFELYVRPSTVLSGPLLQARDAGVIVIKSIAGAP